MSRTLSRVEIWFLFGILVCTMGRNSAFSQDVFIAATDLGLTPESIITSGCEGSVTGILQLLIDEDALRQSLVTHGDSIVQQAGDVRRVSSQLKVSHDNSQLQQEYQTAFNNLLSSLQARSETEDSLFEEVTAELSGQQIQNLLVWREATGRAVPPHFRVRHRSEEEWRAIELALIAERRALRLVENLDPEQAFLLASVRAEPAVVLALARLQAELPAVEAVFDEYAPVE